MRPFAGCLALALLVAAGLPASARTHLSGTLVLTIDVAPGLTPTLNADLWRRLAAESFSADRVVNVPGSGPADTETCRNAGALYALYAGLRPGRADTDRHYVTVHVDERDCVTGTVSSVKDVEIASVPMEEAMAGDYEPDPDRTWAGPMRKALGALAINFPTVGRVRRVEAGAIPLIYIDNANAFRPDDQVVAYATSAVRPREPLPMTIITLQHGYAVARPNGGSLPNVGDYVRIQAP